MPADDPWTSARSAAREDVHAALAPRERRCPACGAVQRGGGRTCVSCGADLTARHPRRHPERKPLYAGLAVMLVMLAALAVPVIGGLREDAAGERARAAARQQALEAAERARLTRAGQPVRATGTPLRAGADPLAHRAALVTEGEQLIAADARARVAAGTLKGDIRGAQCDPYPTTAARRAAEQQRGTRSGRYGCVPLVQVRCPRGQRAGPQRALRLPVHARDRVRRRRARVLQGLPACGRGRRDARVRAGAGVLRDPSGPG